MCQAKHEAKKLLTIISKLYKMYCNRRVFAIGGKEMKKILESKYGLFIFSLISGFAYFALIMMLLAQVKYSYLLGLFFLPAVVCGCALCLYKTIKSMEESGEVSKIKSLIIIHYFVILLALLFVGAKIVNILQ